MITSACVLITVIIFIAINYCIPCENYYFGIGVNQDYKKAFDCYNRSKDPDYIALILMYLNGEGTAKDLKKADDLLTYFKADQAGGNQTTWQLEKHVKEQLANPKGKFARVDYGDIAFTTDDMTHWMKIQQKLQEQHDKKDLENLKKNLNYKAAKILGEIDKQNYIIKELEGERVDMEWIDGTLRGAATGSYEEYLQDNHRDRIMEMVVKHKLKKASRDELQNYEKKLDKLYKKVLVDGEQMCADLRPDMQGEIKQDYAPTVLAARNAWIKYRDKWVELLKIVKPEGMNDEETIEISVKTLLTKERIEEIKFDPMSNQPAH